MKERITPKDDIEIYNAVTNENTDKTQVLKWALCGKDYEDLEEQGLIVRLPCKVGSYIYRVTGDKRKKAPDKCEVVGVWLSEDERSSRVHLYCLTNKGLWYSTELPLSEFGKTLFVEKAEAEKKLKELKGELK